MLNRKLIAFNPLTNHSRSRYVPAQKTQTMKNIYVLIFFTTILSFNLKSQQENFKLADEIKTKETKKNIDEYLVGYWQFREMKSPEGEKIDTLFHPSGELNYGYEIISRTDYYFDADGTYATNEITSSTTPINIDSTLGTWIYSEAERELKLTYDKPKYIIPEGLDPSYVQTLKDQMVLRPIEGTFMEIHLISRNELVVIEHQAHNENELIYNLLYYRKKN